MPPSTREAAPDQETASYTKLNYLQGTLAAASAGRIELDARSRLLELVRANPNWPNVGPTDQARIEELVLGEIDAENNVVTRRSKKELGARYGWSYGQALLTLSALRSNGIAYSSPRHEILADGRPHQVASVYYVVTDGLHLPQAKRELTPKQKSSVKRAVKTRWKRRREARLRTPFA